MSTGRGRGGLITLAFLSSIWTCKRQSKAHTICFKTTLTQHFATLAETLLGVCVCVCALCKIRKFAAGLTAWNYTGPCWAPRTLRGEEANALSASRPFGVFRTLQQPSRSLIGQRSGPSWSFATLIREGVCQLHAKSRHFLLCWVGCRCQTSFYRPEHVHFFFLFGTEQALGGGKKICQAQRFSEIPGRKKEGNSSAYIHTQNKTQPHTAAISCTQNTEIHSATHYFW